MANALEKNMAEDILEKIGVDMFLKTRTKPTYQVNAVLLKVSFESLFDDKTNMYAIMEMFDGKRIISQPTEAEIIKYESYLNKSNWGGASKISNYDIKNEFLAECSRDCNFAFTFFSERTRDSMGLRSIFQNPSNFVLCGFMMMTIAIDKKQNPYLYIDDVCSLGGLGSMLMNLSKNMLSITNIKNLKLTSLDKPVGFYLHFGFKFEKGSNTYYLPEDSPLSYWQYDKNARSLVFSPQNELKGKSKFENSSGFLYNNKPGGPISILPKGKSLSNVSRLKSKTYLMGGPKGKPSQLVKMKTDDDGISMSFKIPEMPRDPVIEAVIRGEAEGNQERIEAREERQRQNIPITPSRKSKSKSKSNRRRYSNSNKRRHSNSNRLRSKKKSNRKLSL